jgi:hypothetical protein
MGCYDSKRLTVQGKAFGIHFWEYVGTIWYGLLSRDGHGTQSGISLDIILEILF